MYWKSEKKRLADKYKQGTWRYYLHLWAKILKSTYHKNPVSCKIEGRNNHVPYIPSNCIIHIFGENNTVEIDPSVSTFVASIEIGDPQAPVSNCTVKIGKKSLCNGANIRLFENNSAVYIGDGCLLSSGIEIWASDSHAILDKKNKQLTNWGKEIFIDNHVWIGIRTIILKNSYIANDCIIGAGSIVAGKFEKPHCILAGNPAKVIKEEISWNELRPLQYQNKFQHEKIS